MYGIRNGGRFALVAAVLAITAGATSAGTASGSDLRDGASAANPSGPIAFLLPETLTTRYQRYDRPFFMQAVKGLCASCKVLYQNAGGDASRQLTQAEQMLARGARVMVIDPVDNHAAAAIVKEANAKNVPVIAYNRVPDGKVAYALLDSLVDIGRLQGQSLLTALRSGGDPKRGDIVVVNGAATTVEIHPIIKGWKSVLNGKVTIGRQYFTPDWDPAKAQSEMEQAITALGKDKIIGVYSMNDGMAGGIAAALKSAGFRPLPPVTGLDGDVAALQRILVGEQYSTLFRDYRKAATGAAKAAVAVVEGKSLPKAPAVTRNGTGNAVPTVYPAAPIVVTKANMLRLIVKPGYVKTSEICTADYAAACKAAGLTK